MVRKMEVETIVDEKLFTKDGVGASLRRVVAINTVLV